MQILAVRVVSAGCVGADHGRQNGAGIFKVRNKRGLCGALIGSGCFELQNVQPARPPGFHFLNIILARTLQNSRDVVSGFQSASGIFSPWKHPDLLRGPPSLLSYECRDKGGRNMKPTVRLLLMPIYRIISPVPPFFHII